LNKNVAVDSFAATELYVISQPRSTFILKVLSLIIATLVTGAVTILITFLSSEHMCSRQSNIVELPLFILTFSLSCFWTAKAKTPDQAWGRTCRSIIIVIVLHIAYQGWLHSDYFPNALFSAKALESMEIMKKKINDRKKMSESKK
jgi:hypothetical protein